MNIQTIPIKLTKSEFDYLEREYPGKINKSTRDRALYIVEKQLKKVYPNCVKIKKTNGHGPDLKIIFKNEKIIEIEVKGTEKEVKCTDKKGLFKDLKVSGVSSYKALVKHKIDLYRVTSVFTKAPMLYVLKDIKKSDLECEPRWRFKCALSNKKKTKKQNPCRLCI